MAHAVGVSVAIAGGVVEPCWRVVVALIIRRQRGWTPGLLGLGIPFYDGPSFVNALVVDLSSLSRHPPVMTDHRLVRSFRSAGRHHLSPPSIRVDTTMPIT